MIIRHLSDTHGSQFWRFADLTNVDIVVHTGDLLPNFKPSDREYEKVYQAKWLADYAKSAQEWLGNRPFLYVPGNHDFVELNKEWTFANRITLTPSIYKGFSFIGYPQVPIIKSFWNFETDATELHLLASKVTDSDADILLTHTPPAGIFASSYGCKALRGCLDYKKHNFKAHLFGHVHQDKYCQDVINGITYSNAAANIRSLESVHGGLVKL